MLVEVVEKELLVVLELEEDEVEVEVVEKELDVVLELELEVVVVL